MRGHHLMSVNIYPIDYVPAEGKLILRKKIHIYVDYQIGKAASKKTLRIRSSKHFDKMIRKSILNPATFDAALSEAATQSDMETRTSINNTSEVTLSEAPSAGNETVEYLIITHANLVSAFQPLADWKTKKGIPAEIVTTDWIYANYTASEPRVQQKQIKLCIRDYVRNHGTEWVVLGGDIDSILDYDCYGLVNGDREDSTIPTDLYYADIDDLDWDDDGDGTAAEVFSDSIDMYPDVFVGRISVNQNAPEQATHYIDKALAYEKNAPAGNFAKKLLLSGVRLWNDGDAEGKSEYMWTDFIDPYWNGTRYQFYDTATSFSGGASYDVDRAHVNEQIANGYNFFHMTTHGNTTIWSMETGSSYSSTQAFAADSPNGYTNIVTIACITNAFDKTDACLGEAFIRDENGGAVSYIGGSRYGWGNSSSTTAHGSSMQYDRAIYKMLFNEECAHNVGVSFAEAKQSMIGSCFFYGSKRWVQFSLNLLGDPELPLYTDDPQTMSPSFAGAASVGSQIFEVNTGISGAKVCLMKGDEVYAHGLADSNGHFHASIAPVTPGTMDVTITAKNHYPFEGTVVISSGPVGMVIFNKDQCDPGDAVVLNLIDTDLEGLSSYTLTVTTDSGDSEAIVLAENTSVTGLFSNSISTVREIPYGGVPNDGTLSVALNDVIRTSYNDADNGSGQPAVANGSVAVVYLAPKNQVMVVEPPEDRVICRLIQPLVWTDTAADVVAYDIYLGTDLSAVQNATMASDEYKETITAMSYDPGQLDQSKAYYWRIDAVMIDNSVQKGSVHRFFTAVTPQALENGKQLEWPLNEDAGITAWDVSDNKNNGTLVNGPTWTADSVVGSALQFDGIDDYVVFSKIITDDFTISFWVKTTMTSDTGSQWHQGNGLVDGEYHGSVGDFGISMLNDRGRAFGVGSPDTTIQTASVINNGQWHHVVGTRDAASGEMILYLDGEQQASITGPTGTKDYGSHLRVGTTQTAMHFFNGSIDELCIYDRTLTPAEVGAIYNSIASNILAAHWTLDETAGTSAVDTSGNGLDADCLGGLSFDSNATTGVLDGAIDLDGTDDYLEAPDGFDDFTSGITVSVWAYTTDYQKWSRFIDFGNGSANDNIILGTYSDTDDLFFEIYNSTDSSGKVIAADAIKLNTWQMFTATCNAQGDARIYVDGQLVQQGKMATPNILTRTNNYLGRSNWSGDEYYRGQLDDVRIYPYCLRPELIESIYLTAVTTPPEGLTANAASGTVSLDWQDIDYAAAAFYHVYRSENSGGPYSRIAQVTNSAFTDTTAANSFTWYYVVTSVNDALMESDESMEVAASPNYPGDLTVDGYVNLDDMAVLSSGWQNPYNMTTLLQIAEDWLSNYLDDSALAHWKFDETAGLAASDSSENNYNGTLINMTGTEWTSGSNGNALAFDGADDYVAIPGYQGITGSTSRTCSAWVKTDSSGAPQMILSWGDSLTSNAWMMYIDPNGKLGLALFGGSLLGTTVVNDGELASCHSDAE